MESFSKEFIGFYNNGIGQTPFLDSLMQNSLVFTNAFANGIKSIEALPAITASIPALMNEPFITSKYAENKFESLANILNKENYSTSFYHGGNRGTMGFYAFCQKAGFKNYYGLEEYDNDKDFDGSWGIYDEPFLQYFATQIKKEKNPFFTTFFSLSSHPPYTVPKNDEFKNKKIGILETIRYSDNALKLYFEKIKKEKWFENTIFVITADHTAGPRYDKKYMNKIGKYAIPLIIFKGDNSIRGVNKKIVQHIDILPTILDIINYSKPFFSFGKSVFDEEQWAIFKIQDKYFFITKNEIIRNTEERYNGFLDWELNQKIKLEKKSINKLKAIKQVYNNRMSNNKIHYED